MSDQTLQQLHEQRDALRAQCEIEVARRQISNLRRLREGWMAGDDREWEPVGRTDSLFGYTSWPTGGVRPIVRRQVHRTDYDQGRFPPFYETENDLLRMLARVRNLATFDAIYIGAGDALHSYTMGGEWTYQAEEAPGYTVPEGLVDAVQREIDQWMEHNDWLCDLDEEIHDASREDGDVLVAHYPEGSNVKTALCYAEHMTEPQNTRQLDEWLGVPGGSWLFGVHTAWSDTLRRWDMEHPLGYHVVFDPEGREWDYLPRWPQTSVGDLDLRCATQIKRNVSRRFARGVSDYWPVLADLEGEWKLARGTREGATLQSYIAYIVEYAEGATAEGTTDALDQDPLFAYNRDTVAQNANNSSMRRKKLVPGSVAHLSPGQKYHAAPMGSLNSPVFVDVAAATLRRLGVRWNMPEYLISGDASNSNYASTLSAGSPFVKARQRDQAFYRRRFRSIVVKMLRIRFLMGAFDRWVSRWEELAVMVDVAITAPDVDIQQHLEQTQRRQLLNAAGVLTREEWAALEELDPEKVFTPAGGAVEQPVQPANEPESGQEVAQADASGEMAGLSRLQWQRNRKAIDDVLGAFMTGETTEAKARALLSGLGLTSATVDALIDDARDGTMDDNVAEALRMDMARRLLFEGYP